MGSGDLGRRLLATTKPDVAGAGKKRKKLVMKTRLPQDIVTQCKDKGYSEVEEEVVADDDKEQKKTEDSSRPMKKRKKLVKTRLPPELVEKIMRRPIRPFPAIPDELLARFSEKCRAAFAMEKAEDEKLMALDAEIIRQYKEKGYAEVEEEVVIDDDGEEQKVEE